MRIIQYYHKTPTILQPSKKRITQANKLKFESEQQIIYCKPSILHPLVPKKNSTIFFFSVCLKRKFPQFYSLLDYGKKNVIVFFATFSIWLFYHQSIRLLCLIVLNPKKKKGMSIVSSFLFFFIFKSKRSVTDSITMSRPFKVYPNSKYLKSPDLQE